MRFDFHVFILVTGIASTVPTAVHATDYWNASLGTGMGGSSDVGGLVSMFDVTVPINNHAITLRAANYYDIFGAMFGSIFSDSNKPPGQVEEFGALVSWIHYDQWSQSSVGTGVSYLRGSNIGIDSIRSSFTTLGVPLYAEAVFTPIRYIGIGIKASTALTPNHSLGVILMTINFGILN